MPPDLEPPSPPSPTAPPHVLNALMPPRGDLWVFGYGSLMWDPGFPFAQAEAGLLHGYHRAFCMVSRRHRGTPERPGLVLALDKGGSCRGMSYRVDRSSAEAVLAYLWDREMARYAYLPRTVTVRLRTQEVQCTTFVADRDHASYAGRLTPQRAARIIRRAHGGRGSNRDYLASTIAHLDELGVAVGPLRHLLRLVDDPKSQDGGLDD